MQFSRMIDAVSVHTEGEPSTVITGGIIGVPGKTMFEKMKYLETERDDLRKFFLHEPRGHVIQCLNLVLPPTDPAADAGFIIAVYRAISQVVAAQIPVRHPERPEIDVCYQVLFTSRSTTTGDVKQTILCPPGSIDRSPCGTGTSARVALMHTRGELPLHQSRRFEGVLDTCFRGEAVAAGRRGSVLYVTPRVTGNAYITGFHQFVLDPADPLPQGFRIGGKPQNEARIMT
jgi:proline racemase